MASSAQTSVRAAHRVQLSTALLPPAAGAVAGAGAGVALEWFAQTSRAFDGVLGVAGYVGEPVGLIVTTSLGLTFGLLLAVSLREEVLHILVGDRRISMRWADARVSVPRSLVRQVVLDSDVVLLGAGSVELARVPCAVDRGQLLRALARHGYPPALPRDPHAENFHTWPVPVHETGVPGRPALTATQELLLGARQRALTDRAWGDAELLRRQLTASGVMVRDVRVRGRQLGQQWRAVTPPPVPTTADSPPLAAALPAAEAAPVADGAAAGGAPRPEAATQGGPGASPVPGAPVP